MDLSFSDNQRLLKDSVERFVAQRYDFNARRAIAAGAERFSPEVWRSMAEFGWLGLPLPEADGGFGGGAIDVGIVMEGLGKGLMLEPYVSTVLLGGGLIAGAGSSAQRGLWLPRIAAGELRLSLAHCETMFASLGAVPGTRATRTDDAWSLQGVKCLALDAPGAHEFIVTAAGKDDALLLFVVPRATPGLHLQAYETLDGRLAANLRLEQVLVSEGRRLAAAPDAGALLAQVLDRAVAALCAEAVGCLQHLLDTTVAYTRTRVQFDRPIASNQVLRHRMVDMAIQCEEARAMSLRAALSTEREPQERAREVSGAKLKITRAARMVSENAVQLHGAMGVTDELDVGSYVKRLLSFEKMFGTPSEHRDRLKQLRARRAA